MGEMRLPLLPAWPFMRREENHIMVKLCQSQQSDTAGRECLDHGDSVHHAADIAVLSLKNGDTRRSGVRPKVAIARPLPDHDSKVVRVPSFVGKTPFAHRP